MLGEISFVAYTECSLHQQLIFCSLWTLSSMTCKHELLILVLTSVCYWSAWWSPNHGKATETLMVWPYLKIFWHGEDNFAGDSEEEEDRRRVRQKKRWEDNIKEWTGIGFWDSLRAGEHREGWKVLLQRHRWSSSKVKGLRWDKCVFPSTYIIEFYRCCSF